METKEAKKKMIEIVQIRSKKKREKFISPKSMEGDKFLNIFDYCLERLEYEYRNVLVNSFINCTYKFWWLEYYSKSTFYRMRERALVSFVSLFEMIYENISDFAY